jgi:hypothetical protein
MDPVRHERRQHPRYALQLPVVISAGTQQLQAVTRDVGAGGIFFYTSEWPVLNPTIEFKMVFPAQLTLSDTMRAICRGTVVRKEEAPDGRTCIAATIDSFQFR